MLKLICTTTLCISLVYTLAAQCEVDAGEDRILCQDEIYDNPRLQGSVINGEIKAFQWEALYQDTILNTDYYASDMLSDTTRLDPQIQEHFEREVKFYLTGKTADDETCTDSVLYKFSDWIFLTIDKVAGKSPEDTIQLYIAAQSNWPHTQYEWSPNIMISDTSIANPEVWNDTTILYHLTITDSLGCSVEDDVFEVYVNPSSTKNLELEQIILYPNPSTSQIRLKPDRLIHQIHVIDVFGNKEISTKNSQVDITRLLPGHYFLRAEFANGETVVKHFIKLNSY